MCTCTIKKKKKYVFSLCSMSPSRVVRHRTHSATGTTQDPQGRGSHGDYYYYHYYIYYVGDRLTISVP